MAQAERKEFYNTKTGKTQFVHPSLQNDARFLSSHGLSEIRKPEKPPVSYNPAIEPAPAAEIPAYAAPEPSVMAEAAETTKAEAIAASKKSNKAKLQSA